VIKTRIMRWAGHKACRGEGIGVDLVSVGRTEGKRPLETPRRRWDDNIKMNLREIYESMGRTEFSWLRTESGEELL
jgi:hypothetical protein